MPRILNFGSLNIDHVYRVDHFVRPGETLDSETYDIFSGGKGANQSIALARAGAEVWHAGKLGADGAWLKEKLAAAGVNTDYVDIIDGPSGHAIIQVNRDGENAIVLHGGANRQVDESDAARIIPQFTAGDYLLLQNEISAIPAIMRQADEHGLSLVLNPAPMGPEVLEYPLELVSLFCVNEIEGGELTGESEPGAILEAMLAKYPGRTIVLTLGERGVLYADSEQRFDVASEKVDAVDTTAAGDTFIGYFLAGLAGGEGIETALRRACRAAAICVTRPGAADSIPCRLEL